MARQSVCRLCPVKITTTVDFGNFFIVTFYTTDKRPVDTSYIKLHLQHLSGAIFNLVTSVSWHRIETSSVMLIPEFRG